MRRWRSVRSPCRGHRSDRPWSPDGPRLQSRTRLSDVHGPLRGTPRCRDAELARAQLRATFRWVRYRLRCQRGGTGLPGAAGVVGGLRAGRRLEDFLAVPGCDAADQGGALVVADRPPLPLWSLRHGCAPFRGYFRRTACALTSEKTAKRACIIKRRHCRATTPGPSCAPAAPSSPWQKPRCIRAAMHPAWTALLLGRILPDMLPRRALPRGRLAALGATRGFTTGC